MPGEIRTVAVAGATGNLGPTLIKELTTAGFEVTALTRSATQSNKFPNVQVAVVDYLNHDSMVSTLKGIDAVVVCGVGMLPEQTNLIDAAISAGVSRFMPACFAGDISEPAHRALRSNRDKVDTDDYLKQHEGQISRMTISTGPLFDFCVNLGVLINMKQHSQTRYNDGSKAFSTTTVATACKAVAAALKLGEKSNNRAFHVHDFVISQKELLRLAEEVTPGVEWKVTTVEIADLQHKTKGLFEANPDDKMAILMERPISVFGEEFRSEFGKSDDAELGIAVMDESAIKELLKSLS